MNNQQRWTIAENVAKKAFGKLAIEENYYPLFKERAIFVLNENVDTIEPDSEEIDLSLVLSGEYIINYVGQIKLGQSELWADTYADNMLRKSKDESVHESYITVEKKQGKDQADKDLTNFAKSICDDPLFVERFKNMFEWGIPDISEKTKEYCCAYRKCIEEGKSDIYAHAYSEAVNMDYYKEFCVIYAESYEQAINQGMSDSEAFGFGKFVTNAASMGLYTYIESFKKEYPKKWQREYYLQLLCDYEKQNKTKLPENEIEYIRKLLKI